MCFQLLWRLRWKDCLSLRDRGCSKPQSHYYTPAWMIEWDTVSFKKKKSYDQRSPKNMMSVTNFSYNLNMYKRHIYKIILHGLLYKSVLVLINYLSHIVLELFFTLGEDLWNFVCGFVDMSVIRVNKQFQIERGSRINLHSSPTTCSH